MKLQANRNSPLRHKRFDLLGIEPAHCTLEMKPWGLMQAVYKLLCQFRASLCQTL